MQVPHGPDHLYCPFWRRKMSAVCHTCPQWVQISGKNPTTGADVSGWHCVQSILPKLLVENAQQARENGAATESMRNELVRLASRPRPPVMIEGH